jgi:hypothetical protein
MDQVRASAAAKTAAEKLIAMRKKMEEYGVDGECSFRIPPPSKLNALISSMNKKCTQFFSHTTLYS